MNDDGVDQPSPTHDDWAPVAEVCPSTLPESYDSPICGTSGDTADGTVTGTLYWNEPVSDPDVHEPDGFNVVAVYDPAGPPSAPPSATAASTSGAAAPATGRLTVADTD